jgi:hypothetical protein
MGQDAPNVSKQATWGAVTGSPAARTLPAAAQE